MLASRRLKILGSLESRKISPQAASRKQESPSPVVANPAEKPTMTRADRLTVKKAALQFDTIEHDLKEHCSCIRSNSCNTLSHMMALDQFMRLLPCRNQGGPPCQSQFSISEAFDVRSMLLTMTQTEEHEWRENILRAHLGSGWVWFRAKKLCRVGW